MKTEKDILNLRHLSFFKNKNYCEVEDCKFKSYWKHIFKDNFVFIIYCRRHWRIFLTCDVLAFLVSFRPKMTMKSKTASTNPSENIILFFNMKFESSFLLLKTLKISHLVKISEKFVKCSANKNLKTQFQNIYIL